MRRPGRGRVLTAALVLLPVQQLVTSAAAHSKPGRARLSVIASGLDNPRGLAFGPGGALYVAESGRGFGGVSSGPCAPNPVGGEPVCLGQTGAITRIDGTTSTRVVTGLASIAVASGATATGPSDISFSGPRGYVAMGLGQDRATRDGTGPLQLGPGAADLGTLLQVNTSKGTWARVADLAAFEEDAGDPDGNGKLESNANGVVAEGSRQVVIDAAGNTVLQVDPDGSVSLIATMPKVTPTIESVPVSAVRGPDGALYVGELTGLFFPVGAARVWRIADGQAPQVYATGFTMISDLAFGADGKLYVLEYSADGSTGVFAGAPQGRLVRVTSAGAPGDVLLDGTDGLSGPVGLTSGPDGALYLTNHSTEAGVGEVLRFKPPR
jgi:hypothetical protein